MNHSIATGLLWGHESVAYFSKQAPDRLLVFVHGFGGSASGTWKGVAPSLLADPKAAATDVIFYGYRSWRRQPEIAAGQLRAFLDDAAGDHRKWKDFVARARPGVALPDYREILIVAHSLGAPVARRAVLDGLRQDRSWAHRARLALFAPAHLGSFHLRLQKQAGGSFGAILASILAVTETQILSLDALRGDSPFLIDLLRDTQDQWARGRTEPVKARVVVFGDGERIVTTGRFFEDPPHDVWDGHDHFSVCKNARTSAAVLEQFG